MILGYLFWHYGRGLQDVVGLVRNFLMFIVHLFSIKELSRSIFAPWKQIEFDYRNIFSTEAWIAISTNAISRVLGAIVRIVLLSLGIVSYTITAAVGAVVIVAWLGGPATPVALFLIGIMLL